ncbi:MAG TPA: hypothetical protein VHZ73_08555 [Vicinamibacterales bacterium]|nr:hypothetical protein [Vicinamibacterales bacterium]
MDDHDAPVRGLRSDDFEIDEDGHAVRIATFSEVSAAGISGSADGRFVTLLLDDTVGPGGTNIMQSIARLFIAPARKADSVAVVRLTHREDEATGPFLVARDHIDDYRSDALPFFGRETVENALQAVTSISRQLEPIADRRKVVICLGRRDVCDPYLATPEESLVWSYWRDALSAAARANVSVYAVDPEGVRGPIDLGDGLVDGTGGNDFARSNNFAHIAGSIWAEAGHYYLLGYTPTAKARELHAINVKVKGRGLHVRARHSRGD